MISMNERLRIREAYKKFLPRLLDGDLISPYEIEFDWFKKFSPIEEKVWDGIRYLGLPLYPQFPIGKYFVDFADPYRRIAIEVDSHQWHKDTEKDKQRQKEIEKLGWRVYRIDSWLTFKSVSDFTFLDETGREQIDWEKYEENTAEGFLRKLYREIGYFENRKIYQYFL